MAADDQAQGEQRATYMALMGIFTTLFAAFSARRRGRRRVRPLDLLMLGLSTYRLGRLTAYDKVAEPWRAPFTATRPDSSGAGKTVVPRGTGVRRALGELVACPICAGTWIAAGLVYGLELLPRPTRVLMTIMSAAGLAELLNAVTEALSWSGRVAREEAGVIQREEPR